MADEGGKPPAGRGGGRGGQRKAKFAPTVPSQRRRKAEEPNGGSAAPSAAEAAAANEAFQDLIRAAQTDAKWQRGRGRGFGRGRGVGSTQVMFGGDGGIDSRRTAVAPQPRPARPKGEDSKAGVKGEGGSSRSRLKPNVKSQDTKGGGAGPSGGGMHGGDYDTLLGSGGEDSSDECQDPGMLFDFEQYTPTTLPLSLHHPLDVEADARADAAVMRHGLPDELALRPDDSEGDTAAQLGLTDLSTAQDTLYLFQLPSMLPLGLPASDRSKTGRQAGPAAAAAGSSSGGGGGGQQQPLRAATARELHSGPVGKLLVFRSGKVKLQMGSCLLDVSAGMPCVSRQDVAAIIKPTGQLIQLGPVTQRAVVCPDVWQLMADQPIPEFPRDLQQLQQALQEAAAAAAANGGDMDVDDDDLGDAEDDGGQPARARGSRKKQVVADSEEEEDEEDGGGGGERQSPGVKVEQQQQPARNKQQQPIASSSEEDAAEDAAAADGAQQQPAAAAAAAAMPPKQPQQQQQQQPPQLVGNGNLGWLDLPAAPVARGGAAGRGRGKFKPSARSPSPAAAAVPPGAGGGGAGGGDAMDVDS